MVVMDLSTSMLATDIAPSRLERSKREVIDLLEMLQGDRIGIVAFAGEAFVQCPLTQDYRMAKLFISQLSLDLMPVQGTALGKAINKAVDSLDKASPEESQGKAIILITDGEDHETDPLKAAERAKEKGIRIFSIGIGSEQGAPIPLSDGGFKKDESGNLILSKLDPETLDKISSLTGGQYLRSTTGDLELDTIYNKGIRGSLTDQDYGSTRQKIWYERFPWFLGVAFFFLFSEAMWREFVPPRRRRKKKGVMGLGWLFLLPALVGVSQRGEAGSSGQSLYEKKEYDKATEAFEKEEKNHPDDLTTTYNRAVSQFRNGQFDAALEGFAKAGQSQDPQLRQKAQFNLGNTLVAKGKLKEAAGAYEGVLKESPQNIAAKENLQWVERKISQEEKEKKEDKDKKDDQKKDEKKEDQKEQEKKEGDQKKEDSDKKDEGKKEESKKDESGKKDPSKDGQDGKKEEKKEEPDSGKDKESESKKEEKKEGEKSEPENPEKKEGADAAKPEEGKAGESKPTAPESAEQLDRKAAERLLRSIEADEEVYGVPFQAEPGKKPSSKQKDW